MNQKLDAFDRKILQILLSNSRESVTSMSKKIELGRENVDYKLKRLVSMGFIKDFITEFNEKALRINHHILFAQLIRLRPNDEKDILDYLKQHKYISWLGTAAGKWTLICDIYLTEEVKLSQIINELLTKLGKHIEEYSLLELESGEYFFEKYLEEKPDFVMKKKKKTPTRRLDLIDYKILSLLNQNSRINYAELSEKIGLTANGIKKRIKDLEKTVQLLKQFSCFFIFHRNYLNCPLVGYSASLSYSLRSYF